MKRENSWISEKTALETNMDRSFWWSVRLEQWANGEFRHKVHGTWVNSSLAWNLETDSRSRLLRMFHHLFLWKRAHSPTWLARLNVHLFLGVARGDKEGTSNFTSSGSLVHTTSSLASRFPGMKTVVSYLVTVAFQFTWMEKNGNSVCCGKEVFFF